MNNIFNMDDILKDKILNYIANDYHMCRDIAEKFCISGNIDDVKTICSIYNLKLRSEMTFGRLFIASCNNNHIHIARWLLDQHGTILYSTKNYALLECCKNRNFDIFKWLYDLEYTIVGESEYNKYDEKTISENKIKLIKESSKNNDINIAKYLFENNKYDKNTIIDVFSEICKNDNLGMMKWFYKLNKVIIDNSLQSSNYTIKIAITNLFEYDNLNILKWLYNENKKIIDNVDIYDMYKIKNIGVAEWFIKYANINQDTIKNMFLKYCEFGNMNMTKWLYKKNTTYLNKYIKQAFYKCCTGYITSDKNILENIRNNKIEIMKWLYTIDNTLINNCFDDFYCCCIYNNVDAAKWIYSFGNINIETDNHKVFKDSCIFVADKVASWLCEINIKYQLLLDSNNNIKYTIIDKSNEEIYNDIIKMNNLKCVDKKKDDKCPICLKNLNEINVQIIGTVCNHILCIECYRINHIIKNNKLCSVCRSNVK